MPHSRSVSIVEAIRVIRARRKNLRSFFDLDREFKTLEESCVPSYLHGSPFAAALSWWRLLVAARLVRKMAPEGAVLDFGSATGEIFRSARPWKIDS